MQTSNLSNPVLGELGDILPAVPTDEFVSVDLGFSASAEQKRYYAESHVIIDYLEGMASLILYEEDTRKVFYLDRIVRLQPGVLFSVAPLEEQCRVRLYLQDASALQEKDMIYADFLQQEPPSLEFERIYTFLYQQTPDSFYFHGESHTPYELVYVEQGLLHIIVEGQNVELHPQQCLIIGKNSWHIQYADEPMQFFTASFDMKSPYLDPLVSRPLQVWQELAVLPEKMVQELKQSAFSGDYIESLMKIFLIELIRQPQSQAGGTKYPATSYAENQIVSGILQMISQRIYGKISLHQLAEQAHISVPYLYTLFDRHIGMPPGKYIMKIRIEESKLLLQEGKMSVGEIAACMGFTSIQHFSRQFKNFCGMPPSRYMK